MLIEFGLFEHLKGDAAIAALVGDGGSPVQVRIWPLKLLQNWTSPAITYQRVTAGRGRSLDGPTGRASPLIQIDVWAREGDADGGGRKGYMSAKNLADLVRRSIDGFTGTMGTVAVGTARLGSDRDLYEDDTGVHRVSMDFTITHTEG